MTLFVVTYNRNTGDIIGHRHVVDHDYTPEANELIVDHGDSRQLRRQRVDTTADPPEVVTDPESIYRRPGVVDPETREIIGDKFRDKGADALAALDAIEANSNIPAEVTSYLQASFAMQYLTYVSLMGQDARIDAVEQRFFG